MKEKTEIASTKTIKVNFYLETEEDGWPPIGTEVLHAIPLGNDEAQLDNTPFFATSVSVGDVIKVSQKSSTKSFDYEHLVKASGNSAISILLRGSTAKETVSDLLTKFAFYFEYGEFGNTKMFAVSVKGKNEYSEIKPHLDRMEVDGLISFAELCLA